MEVDEEYCLDHALFVNDCVCSLNLKFICVCMCLGFLGVFLVVRTTVESSVSDQHFAFRCLLIG